MATAVGDERTKAARAVRDERTVPAVPMHAERALTIQSILLRPRSARGLNGATVRLCTVNARKACATLLGTKASERVLARLPSVGVVAGRPRRAQPLRAAGHQVERHRVDRGGVVIGEEIHVKGVLAHAVSAHEPGCGGRARRWHCGGCW